MEQPPKWTTLIGLNAPSAHATTIIDFRQLCIEFASATAAGTITLNAAVDALYRAAVGGGLVLQFGDAVVQEVMSVAFETAKPPWRTRRAAESTIEALMYSLRSRGVAALTESDTLRRLSELSEQQLIEVGDRLQKLKPHIAKAWPAVDVAVLVSAWEARRHD